MEVQFRPPEINEYDLPAGFELVSDEMVESRRWTIAHEAVIRHVESGTFWKGRYHEPATENQEWEDEPVKFWQVWPGPRLTMMYFAEKPTAMDFDDLCETVSQVAAEVGWKLEFVENMSDEMYAVSLREFGDEEG